MEAWLKSLLNNGVLALSSYSFHPFRCYSSPWQYSFKVPSTEANPMALFSLSPPRNSTSKNKCYQRQLHKYTDGNVRIHTHTQVPIMYNKLSWTSSPSIGECSTKFFFVLRVAAGFKKNCVNLFIKRSMWCNHTFLLNNLHIYFDKIRDI